MYFLIAIEEGTHFVQGPSLSTCQLMLHNSVCLLYKTLSSFPEKMANWVFSPPYSRVLFAEFWWENEDKTILQHKYFLPSAEPVSRCCNIVFLYGFCSCPPHLGSRLKSTLFSCRPDHPSGAVWSLLWVFPSSHQDPQCNHLCRNQYWKRKQTVAAAAGLWKGRGEEFDQLCYDGAGARFC